MQVLCGLTDISRWRPVAGPGCSSLANSSPRGHAGGQPRKRASVGRPCLTLQGGSCPVSHPSSTCLTWLSPRPLFCPCWGVPGNWAAESVCPSGFELSLLGRDGHTPCSNRAKAWPGRALYLLLWPARCPLRLEGLFDSSLPGLGGAGGAGDEGLKGQIIQVEPAAAVTSPCQP